MSGSSNGSSSSVVADVVVVLWSNAFACFVFTVVEWDEMGRKYLFMKLTETKA